jgi:hypothetical protein
VALLNFGPFFNLYLFEAFKYITLPISMLFFNH